MSEWQVAALVFATGAAWYIQYLARWASGPFDAFDWLRVRVAGVYVTENIGTGETTHFPARQNFHATSLLECSRCTLFWVGIVTGLLVYFLPQLVVFLGVVGYASKLDDLG